MAIAKEDIALVIRAQLLEQAYDSLPDVWNKEGETILEDVLNSMLYPVAMAAVEARAVYNDNFLAEETTEQVVRTDKRYDRLSEENVYKITKVRTTPDYSVVTEVVSLKENDTYITLISVPDNPLTVSIYLRNLPSRTSDIRVRSTNPFSYEENKLYLDTPVTATQAGTYVVEYTDTGDIFVTREVVKASIDPSGRKIFQLKTNVVPNSEGLIDILSNYRFVKVVGVEEGDYQIFYSTGVVVPVSDYLTSQDEIFAEYMSRVDLGEDSAAYTIASQTEVKNEVAAIQDFNTTIENPRKPFYDNDYEEIETSVTFSLKTIGVPVLSVQRIWNDLTDEDYELLDIDYNTVRMKGYFKDPQDLDNYIQATYNEVGTILSTSLAGNEVSTTVEIPQSALTDFQVPLNHPVSFNFNREGTHIGGITGYIVNETPLILVGTVERIITADVYLRRTTTSLQLEYDPFDISAVKIYEADDPTKAQKVTVVSYDTETQRLYFTAPAKETVYTISYESTHWKYDINANYNKVILNLGPTRIPVLQEGQYLDYTTRVSEDKSVLSILFTATGLNTVNSSDVYITIKNKYEPNTTQYSAIIEKNTVNFTRILRTDDMSLERIELEYAYFKDVIRISYEWGDNSIDWSPSMTYSQIKQQEDLVKGETKVRILGDISDNPNFIIYDMDDPLKNPATTITVYHKDIKLLEFKPLVYGATYIVEYQAVKQLFKEGTSYYITYGYGARRDALANHFAQLIDLFAETSGAYPELQNDLGPDIRVPRIQYVWYDPPSGTMTLNYQPLYVTEIRAYYIGAVKEVVTGSDNQVVAFSVDNSGNYVPSDGRLNQIEPRYYNYDTKILSVDPNPEYHIGMLQRGWYALCYQSIAWEREEYRAMLKKMISLYLVGPTIKSLEQATEATTGEAATINELNNAGFISTPLSVSINPITDTEDLPDYLNSIVPLSKGMDFGKSNVV